MGTTPAEAMAAAVHDVRSSVGSIRLAVTSVLEDDEDADFRRTMLSGAEAETRRLNGALAALPALVAAMTDVSESAPVDLVAALRDAADSAKRREVDVSVEPSAPVHVRARAASLTEVLAAVCVLVADAGGDVVADAAGTRARIQRADGGAIRWDRALVHHLVGSVGAEVAGDSSGVELAFPGP